MKVEEIEQLLTGVDEEKKDDHEDRAGSDAVKIWIDCDAHICY
jgi:hypothetical protein